jgi:hypothetical protein
MGKGGKFVEEVVAVSIKIKRSFIDS